jgi:hypothetical protein
VHSFHYPSSLMTFDQPADSRQKRALRCKITVSAAYDPTILNDLDEHLFFNYEVI